ncbi:MAG: radical SAM protein [Candidatus Omnitrophota bacterium]
MKILLLDPHGTAGATKSYLPLGLMYLQSYLKQNGYPLTSLRWVNNIKRKEFLKLLKTLDPDVLGIPCLSGSRFLTLALAREAKAYNPRIRVILGGHHATYLRQQILGAYPFVDYVVKGEGEVSLKELLDHIRLEKNVFEAIPGISLRDHRGQFLDGPVRGSIVDLDRLPFPCYDDICLRRGFLPRFSILTSRGCLFHCTFCSATAFYGYQRRFRSVKSVVAELSYLKQNFKVKRITFNDDLLTANMRHSCELFEAIACEDFGFEFEVQTHYNFLDKKLLRLMKAAGVVHLAFGLESGSARILKKVNRNLPSAESKSALKETARLGIMTCANVIVGWPQRDWQSLIETARQLCELNPYYFRTYLLVILPGSALYEESKKKGIIREEFWLKKPVYPVYGIMESGLWGAVILMLESYFLMLFFLCKTRSWRRFSMLSWVRVHSALKYIRDSYLRCDFT